jgi:competence protein ComEC
MPFPFLLLALSLAAGILVSSLLSLSMVMLILSLLICLGCAWLSFLFKKRRLSISLLLLTTIIFGASLYSISNKRYERNSLRKLKDTDYIDLYGKVNKSSSRGPESHFLFMRVERVVHKNKTEKIEGNIRITVPISEEFPSSPDLFVGDKIKASARLSLYEGFRNFKTFSTQRYLQSQDIHCRAFSKSPLLIEKLESGGKFSPLRLISVIHRKLQEKIEKHFSSTESNSLSPQGAILEALLLGDRARMSPSDTQSLQKSGIFHIIAISGAHIAIISFFLFSIFKLVRIPTRLSYLLVIASIVFYSFLVEGRASVVRAAIMSLAFLLGKLIWRNVNLVNTISIAAFILLIHNPLNLFDSGFQLTFAATLSIILFFPKIIKYLPRLPLRISEMFVISLGAQLGVMPIIASVFNRIAFSSVILNFAAVPLTALIMAGGFIFFPLSFINPFLAQLWAKAVKILINLLTGSSHLFNKLPFLSYRIPTPHLFTIIGYFIFLCLLLLPSKFKRQKVAFSLCFLFFFILLISYPFPSHSKNLRLTFIDVGQGESILIEFPGHKKMLVDGGGLPEKSFDIGENVVSPFLWNKGIKKINYLVLTHAHPDHFKGLKAVASNFRIGEFWEAFSPSEDKAYKEFKESLPSSLPCKRTFRGASLQEGGVRIDVLYPEKADPIVPSADNNQSIVIRLEYAETSFLLTGDIELQSETRILELGGKLKSQVLKSPHHGSSSSSSEAFLEKVEPKIAVISVGEGNMYGFPAPDVLKRYEEMRIKVYRTDIHGAVELASDGRKISIRTASDSLQPLD